MPTYEGVYRGTLHGAEAWSFSCAVTGSGSLADAASAFDDADTAMWGATNFSTRWDDGIAWVDCLVNQIPDGGGIVIDSQVVATPHTGGSAGGSLPNQCAVVVSKQTGFAGSRNRGRMFLPPVAKASTEDNGRLTSTSLTALAAGLTAWKNSLIGDGFTPVLVSVSESANVVITNFRVGDVIDTMRSRRNALAEAYTNVPV